jgi:hypothetical protein
LLRNKKNYVAFGPAMYIPRNKGVAPVDSWVSRIPKEERMVAYKDMKFDINLIDCSRFKSKAELFQFLDTTRFNKTYPWLEFRRLDYETGILLRSNSFAELGSVTEGHRQFTYKGLAIDLDKFPLKLFDDLPHLLYQIDLYTEDYLRVQGNMSTWLGDLPLEERAFFYNDVWVDFHDLNCSDFSSAADAMRSLSHNNPGGKYTDIYTFDIYGKSYTLSDYSSYEELIWYINPPVGCQHKFTYLFDKLLQSSTFWETFFMPTSKIFSWLESHS